jgi:hypothetical protein
MLEVKGTGLIYRNPKPHVWSRHAYFPSVVNLRNGELLCSLVLGQAFESADGRLHLARCADNGATWELQGRMLPEDRSRVYSETGRIACLGDGSLVAIVEKCDRHRTEDGYTNPQTLGFVETELFVYRSRDKGLSWSAPERLEPPLVGPEWEICSPIVELSDGRWMLPTSTWRAWDGTCPNGMKAVALFSHDRGKTWPECADVMNRAPDKIIHWEQKIVEMEPGTLLSVAWAYDEANAKNLPNQYAISSDAGRTWAAPRATDLSGETAATLPLSGNRVLVVYRRVDTPGLWAAEASIERGIWKTERQFPLWGAPSVYTGSHSGNMPEKFAVLRFGAPCITKLDDGDIFIAFWCVEDCVSNIRWFRVTDKTTTAQEHKDEM